MDLKRIVSDAFATHSSCWFAQAQRYLAQSLLWNASASKQILWNSNAVCWTPNAVCWCSSSYGMPMPNAVCRFGSKCLDLHCAPFCLKECGVADVRDCPMQCALSNSIIWDLEIAAITDTCRPLPLSQLLHPSIHKISFKFETMGFFWAETPQLLSTVAIS